MSHGFVLEELCLASLNFNLVMFDEMWERGLHSGSLEIIGRWHFLKKGYMSCEESLVGPTYPNAL